MFYITSISPQAGQGAVSMFDPNIQNAGQSPCPDGIWTRVSSRPYCCEKRPFVSRRALV
jgi:hypothetical protein